MLYLILLTLVAFRDNDELAHPWTYAGYVAVPNALYLGWKVYPWPFAAIVGAVLFVFLGLVFRWLSSQVRFSFGWWLALMVALTPCLAMLADRPK